MNYELYCIDFRYIPVLTMDRLLLNNYLRTIAISLSLSAQEQQQNPDRIDGDNTRFPQPSIGRPSYWLKLYSSGIKGGVLEINMPDLHTTGRDEDKV